MHCLKLTIQIWNHQLNRWMKKHLSVPGMVSLPIWRYYLLHSYMADTCSYLVWTQLMAHILEVVLKVSHPSMTLDGNIWTGYLICRVCMGRTDVLDGLLEFTWRSPEVEVLILVLNWLMCLCVCLCVTYTNIPVWIPPGVISLNLVGYKKYYLM